MNVVSFPQRLRLIDWQTLSSERMAALYAEEVDRWQRLLDWETAARWQEIELRRRQGGAAGLAVVDDSGNVLGWCHYAVRDRVLRLDTFSTDDERIADMMLDRLLSAPALAYVERVSAFLFTDLNGIAQTLRARGLSVDRYWYLGRELGTIAPPALQGMRRWRPEDALATVALLSRSYDAATETRPFAPTGTADQWSAYVSEIVRGLHGPLVPEASLCLPAGPDKLAALAIVTRIGENSAHLTQLVVDPQSRRRRIGQQLMEMASAAAARAGYRRLSVIVGGGNRPARAFFEASRYRSMGSLLAAGTFQPRRSTRVAPGGMAVTRR